MRMVPQTISKGCVLAIAVALLLFFSFCTAMREPERRCANLRGPTYYSS
jgi:hypothetical protein